MKYFWDIVYILESSLDIFRYWMNRVLISEIAKLLMKEEYTATTLIHKKALAFGWRLELRNDKTTLLLHSSTLTFPLFWIVLNRIKNSTRDGL